MGLGTSAPNSGNGQSSSTDLRRTVHRKYQLPFVDEHLRLRNRLTLRIQADYSASTRNNRQPATASPTTRVNTKSPAVFRVLDVPVHAVQIPHAVSQIECWIQSGAKGRYVAVTGMHGIAESWNDSDLRLALDS